MAAGAWQINNFPAANTQATVAVTAGTTGGQAIRLRALQVYIGGTSAGAATFVVRDGTTGAGTIIWEVELFNAANGGTSSTISSSDLRAISGTLTVETTGAGGSGTQISVNAQGDLIQIGKSFADS